MIFLEFRVKIYLLYWKQTVRVTGWGIPIGVPSGTSDENPLLKL